jgi:hypothetical protein
LEFSSIAFDEFFQLIVKQNLNETTKKWQIARISVSAERQASRARRSHSVLVSRDWQLF